MSQPRALDEILRTVVGRNQSRWTARRPGCNVGLHRSPGAKTADTSFMWENQVPAVALFSGDHNYRSASPRCEGNGYFLCKRRDAGSNPAAGVSPCRPAA